MLGEFLTSDLQLRPERSVERLNPLGTIVVPEHRLHNVTTAGSLGRLDRVSSLNRNYLLQRIVPNALKGYGNNGEPFWIDRVDNRLFREGKDRSDILGEIERVGTDEFVVPDSWNSHVLDDVNYLTYVPAGPWGHRDLVTISVHPNDAPIGIRDIAEHERELFFRDQVRQLDLCIEEQGEAMWGLCSSAGTITNGPQSVLYLHTHGVDLAPEMKNTPFKEIQEWRSSQRWDDGIARNITLPRLDQFKDLTHYYWPGSDTNHDNLGVTSWLPGFKPADLLTSGFFTFWDNLSFQIVYSQLESFVLRHYERPYRDFVAVTHGSEPSGNFDRPGYMDMLRRRQNTGYDAEEEILNALEQEGRIAAPPGWIGGIWFRPEGALLAVTISPMNGGPIEGFGFKLQREPTALDDTDKRYESIKAVLSH